MKPVTLLLIVAAGAIGYLLVARRAQATTAAASAAPGYYIGSVPGLKAEHFGRPAVIDGVYGILL
jgi:hypothetical protein